MYKVSLCPANPTAAAVVCGPAVCGLRGRSDRKCGRACDEMASFVATLVASATTAIEWFAPSLQRFRAPLGILAQAVVPVIVAAKREEAFGMTVGVVKVAPIDVDAAIGGATAVGPSDARRIAAMLAASAMEPTSDVGGTEDERVCGTKGSSCDAEADNAGAVAGAVVDDGKVGAAAVGAGRSGHFGGGGGPGGLPRPEARNNCGEDGTIAPQS